MKTNTEETKNETKKQTKIKKKNAIKPGSDDACERKVSDWYIVIPARNGK